MTGLPLVTEALSGSRERAAHALARLMGAVERASRLLDDLARVWRSPEPRPARVEAIGDVLARELARAGLTLDPFRLGFLRSATAAALDRWETPR